MKILQSNLALKQKTKNGIIAFHSDVNSGSNLYSFSSTLLNTNKNLRINTSSIYKTEKNFLIIIPGEILNDFGKYIPEFNEKINLKINSLKNYFTNYQVLINNYGLNEAFNKAINGEFNDAVSNFSEFNLYYNEGLSNIKDDKFYFKFENSNGQSFGETNKITINEIDKNYISEILLPINDSTTSNIDEGFDVDEKIKIKYVNDFYNYNMEVNSFHDAQVDSEITLISLRFNENDFKVLKGNED